MNRALLGGIIILGLLAFAAFSSLFTVHQTQQALIVRFGEVQNRMPEPGLHWKIPFAENVVYINGLNVTDIPMGDGLQQQQRRAVEHQILYGLKERWCLHRFLLGTNYLIGLLATLILMGFVFYLRNTGRKHQ